MNKKYYGVNVGSSSIIMIFVILCLVSFGALSIVSANSDYKLSQKIADRTTAYYKACNEAERSIANIETVLYEQHQRAENEDVYFASVGTEKHFMIPISDYQSLEISLEILYPASSKEALYRITSWQVIVTGEPEYDDRLNVIQ